MFGKVDLGMFQSQKKVENWLENKVDVFDRVTGLCRTIELEADLVPDPTHQQSPQGICASASPRALHQDPPRASRPPGCPLGATPHACEGKEGHHLEHTRQSAGMQGNVQTIALPSYVGGVGGHRVELLTFVAFGMCSVLFLHTKTLHYRWLSKWISIILQ